MNLKLVTACILASMVLPATAIPAETPAQASAAQPIKNTEQQTTGTAREIMRKPILAEVRGLCMKATSYPSARLPHQPLDLEPLRHGLVNNRAVPRVQRFRHRPPRLHPRRIVGMRREPRLDIAAAFRRQLGVDVSMQLVFGDGNVGVGHLCGALE